MYYRLKMCRCSSIIIQPGTFLTPWILGASLGSYISLIKPRNFCFSLKSLVVTDEDMMNDSHCDRVHLDYSDFNYDVKKKLFTGGLY